MRRLAFAVAAGTLLSVGVAARTTTQAAAQKSTQPALAASHATNAAPAAADSQADKADKGKTADKAKVDQANETVKNFCATCHDDSQMPGGVSFEHYDAATVDPGIAMRMVKKLKAGQMPPPGMPKPDEDALKNLIALMDARSTSGIAAAAPVKASLPPLSPLATEHVGDKMTAASMNAFVKGYCQPCHNDRMKTGGQTFGDHFDAAKAPEMAETAEKMIHMLHVGMMPASYAPRHPDRAVVLAFVNSLESRLDAAAVNVNPGWRSFQRLNRVEYAQSVHDLLGLDIDVDQFLPPDTLSNGFDNVADAQGFSPTLMQGYLRAASEIARLAVGDLHATASSTTYKLGRTLSQMNHVDGAPMGTRGGVSVVHIFPADGEYVFKASMHYEPLGHVFGAIPMVTMNLHEQVDVSINGRRVALLDLNPKMSETDLKNGLTVETPPIHVQAGPQRVSAAFIRVMDGPIDDLVEPLGDSLADVSNTFGITDMPHMRDFTVLGPMRVTGVSNTVSREKIFTCRPISATDEQACASQIVKRLSNQAYRGQATAADVQQLMGLYAQGRKTGTFEDGIRLAVQGMLANPSFLFRLEDQPTTAKAGQSYRLSDLDLASRLSYFIWGTEPDAELIKVARAGQLQTPLVLDKQVHRMLQDPRADALSTRFAAQWLRLQDLDKIHPDYLQYPMYDDTLAAAMKQETELFFDDIVHSDKDILTLLTADYSFVNERLAKHYGLPNVTGSEFRKVMLPPYRRGLLGQGSILTLTSVADRTSPVQRGKWIMEVLLDSPPPPPPPNVNTNLDESASAVQGGKVLSTRERMEQHRANPACASCHSVIDPLGLALDNFDVTGAWRIKDNEVPVDTAGQLYDGSKITGPADLQKALLNHSYVFEHTFTRYLMTYALGRRIQYFDQPTIRQIIRQAEKNGNHFSAYILGIVNSPAFRMSKPEAPTTTTAAAAERPR
ncbi:MAG TPA: DUF1592 domain-containing protein [Vicinamibacterales bacterium]|jgi:hypothetical protein